MRKTESDNKYILRSFLTLLKREISRFLKIYVQTLVAPFISNLMFLGIFSGIFASRSAAAGTDYISFLVPRLIASGVILSSFQNPSFSIITQKYQDTLKEYNLYPLPPVLRFLAFSLGGAVRGTIVGIMTYLAAGLFSGYSVFSFPLFWIYIFILAFVFSAAGTLIGLRLDSFEKINFIVTIFLTPLLYLGGIFFDVAKLPGIWKVAGTKNPFFILVAVSRYLFTGYFPGMDILSVLIFTLVLSLVIILSVRKAGSSYGFQID